MRLTVFGGACEIGGNQILLEGLETKILLDFGRNFSRESKYFAEPFLSAKRLHHLLELGLLPNIEGLYDGTSQVSGVFLSHAHLDHMDYVRFTKNVPIYAGEGTWRVILAREITTTRWGKEYKLAEFVDKAGRLHQCVQANVEVKREQVFRTGDTVEVGEFKVRPIHVDHSVPASYGFVIDGPEGRVVYTGDFRFHGPRSEFSEEFLREAVEPDLLIMEGTNVLSSKPSSEEEVKKKVEEIVGGAEGLVVASFSSVDIDRMRTFYEAAKQANRKLVISMRQAALMEFIGPEVESGIIQNLFTLEDPDVLVFMRTKDQVYSWERKIAEQFSKVDYKWVSEHQHEVLMCATYYDMLELLSMKPRPGSVFIYSESEPWDEEGEIEFEKMANWLEELGMPMFHVHASGHATSLELKGVLERLKPKKVVVVHCERPKLFKKFLGDERVICPEWGKQITIG